MAQATDSVHVSLGARSYDVLLGEQLLAQTAALIQPWLARAFGADGSRQAAIITDRNVTTHADTVRSSLDAAGWRTDVVVAPPGESSKSLPMVSEIYDRLADLHADRKSPVIAVGGGVVGDLAGFAAATFNRGVPFIQVPTTLLADVDSSVGGKVGVNLPRAKNLIGAFHQPLGVLIDTSCLQTLPTREYVSGLAEVVKYGVILDAEFFDWLEANIARLVSVEAEAVRQAIARSCRLKADVVEQDEFERSGVRAALNYGHTFAHAFEAMAGYGELLHGEAVSLGIVCASRLAERLGRISPELTLRQVRLLGACGLPTSVPASLRGRDDELLAAMRLDKKSVGGRLRFVLPARLGHVEVVSDVRESDVLQALD